MPLSRIEVRRPRPEGEVQALIEAVYEAQREALGVPEDDRQIRYVEYSPERFAAPPPLEKPPLENWGIRGGQPASEVDLGFDLDV